MSKEHDLSEIASRQYGVFTIEQAEACGFSRAGIDDREHRGAYRRLYPSVLAVAGAPGTWRSATMAAILSIGAPAAASHRSAAFLWGLLPSTGPRIHIVTRRWDRRHRMDVVLHESLDLLDDDITVVANIPVTTPARTVVDLGAVAPFRVERALENGIASNKLTLSEVERFFVRVARRGRRGVGVIRPLLAERRRWDGVTESDLEDLFRAVLTRFGVPFGVAQFPVPDAGGGPTTRPDVAYPAQRLAIELDGEAYHMDRVTFRYDRRKQNRLELLGWRVLRYTWWDLIHRPAEVATEIRRALSVLA